MAEQYHKSLVDRKIKMRFHVRPMNRILIVDDDTAILDVIASYLDGSPYEVLTENDPRQAIQIIERHELFLVLSDLSMPHHKGTDVLAHARTIRPDFYRILMSGQFGTGDHVLEAQVREACNPHFLMSKPFHPNALRTNLAQLGSL
jgi:CheY-like chemotaxis protein